MRLGNFISVLSVWGMRLGKWSFCDMWLSLLLPWCKRARRRGLILKVLLSTREAHLSPRPADSPVALDTGLALLEDYEKTEGSREDAVSGKTIPSTSCKEEDSPPRFGKRKKFAALISYSGSGYSGMQLNHGVRAIENDLLSALCKAKAFPEYMENNLYKLEYQRCSRTDKGVSAARQLISIKHMVELDDPVTAINAHLPPKIRVMAVKRVTRSFNSRFACIARMYEYLMPTYAFAPYHQTTPQYRIPESTLSLVNELLGVYVGTRNYHNFTTRRKFSDMSSRRCIMSFKVTDKFICGSTRGTKELEFIVLKVKGQSFVLNQIRKMIGCVIAVVRGRLDRAVFENAFGEEEVDTPKAPALGLLLDDVYFDHYNAKFASNGERERLEWEELRPEIELFKQQHIYQTIIDTEIREMSMMQWLPYLLLYDHKNARRLRELEARCVHATDFTVGDDSQVTANELAVESLPTPSDPTYTSDTAAPAPSDSYDTDDATAPAPSDYF